MKVLRQFAVGIFAIVFMASSAVMLFAGDPPSRVARLNYMSGQVSMQPGGVNDWGAATINRPMTTADRLWTDKDSRAELQLGAAAMRMDSNTSLTLSNLSDNTVQLELDQGTLNLDLARLWNGQIYEVDTPNMAFTIEKPGIYRFDVDSQDDMTIATVWRGKGIATGDGQAVKIDSRKQVRFEGGMSLEHASFKAPHFDGFDEWCQMREDREVHSVSVRYVSQDVIGYQDLDQYGYWREVPAYGNVWFPSNVVAGWAPYRYGHWVWVDPWGWTWVDDAAWGFAPFHYGRWVTVAGAWAWVPGPIAARPYYAPALVAWVGGGAGIGWFPLGYGEPYIPSYHVSRTYFETVNVSNTRITNITYVSNNYYNNHVDINNIHYVNQTTAVTIVNNDVLVNSRRVDRDSWIDHDRDRHDDHDYRVMAGGPAVPPSHESVLGGDRGRSSVEPPERVFGRRVVTNVKPPERPVAFETRHPDADDHRAHPFNNGEDDRMGKHMPVTPRPDQDAHNGNSRGNAWGNSDRRDQQSSSDDRDRHNPMDPRGDSSATGPHGPRRGDDDRNNQNSAGDNQSAHQHPEQDSHLNDWDHRNGNAGMPQSNNPNWNRGQQADSSAEGRFPHPPRRGDDIGQQQAASGGYQPAPKQADQNPNRNDGERRNNSAGMPQSNNRNWGSGDQGDSSAEGHYPHPQRGNDDGQQQSASAPNQPAPRHGWQNQNGNDGQGQNGQSQNNNAGMPQSNNQSGGRGEPGDSSAQGRSPHPPPQRGNDNGQQQSTSAPYQPAPRQAVQNPNGNDGQRGYGNAGMSGNPNQNRGEASSGGYQPAPKQAVQNPNGNDGPQQRSNPAGNDRFGANGEGMQGGDSSPDRQVPRPPYAGGRGMPTSVQQPVTSPSSANRNVNASASPSQGAPMRDYRPETTRQAPPQSSGVVRNPGSPAQVVDRPMQRPAQAQNSAPQPMPAPHMAQAQPAPHSQSHPAPPSNAGANASAHGNSFQDHPKTPQDH